MSVLAIDNLSVMLPQRSGNVELLQNCSFTIAAGQVLALVGESGSGKSLLANACLGMFPRNAHVSGAIELEGENLCAMPQKSLQKIRGKTAAMIFQNPTHALNPFFNLLTQLSAVLKFRRNILLPAEQREKICTALARVGLENGDNMLKRYPHELSGGQLQRVMIAMALLCKPKLLIADEPTTALDVTVQHQVLDLLRSLVDDYQLAMLFISHDLSVVASIADDVAVMYSGSVVEYAPAFDLLRKPAHPYTDALLQASARLGGAPPKAIPGQVPNPADRSVGCSFEPRCSFAQKLCAESVPSLQGVKQRLACFNPLHKNEGADFE